MNRLGAAFLVLACCLAMAAHADEESGEESGETAAPGAGSVAATAGPDLRGESLGPAGALFGGVRVDFAKPAWPVWLVLGANGAYGSQAGIQVTAFEGRAGIGARREVQSGIIPYGGIGVGVLDVSVSGNASATATGVGGWADGGVRFAVTPSLEIGPAVGYSAWSIHAAGRALTAGAGYGAVDLAWAFGAMAQRAGERAEEGEAAGPEFRAAAVTPAGTRLVRISSGEARVLAGDPIEVTLLGGEVERGLLQSASADELVVLPGTGEARKIAGKEIEHVFQVGIAPPAPIATATPFPVQPALPTAGHAKTATIQTANGERTLKLGEPIEVELAEGTKVKGILREVTDDGMIHVQTGAGDQPIPVESVLSTFQN